MSGANTPGRKRGTEPAPGKQPFRIGVVLRRVRAAVKPYPKAALFELAELGHRSAFEFLAACIISVRARDETPPPTARRLFARCSPAVRPLFARARTPAEVAALSVDEIDALIRGCSFHEAKARQIHDIARRAVAEFGGALPSDPKALLGLRGVGPKCANLVLGIACEMPFIGVDVHVHRVANRWGFVHTRTPEQTTAALGAVLPKKYRVEINALLVPFGKHVCTGVAPKCSTCPVLAMCRQVGVTRPR
jgi:endonuclease-3